MADVVYPAVLLAFGRGISLLLTMVGCIQSGLWALAKIFCRVEALMDAKGNALIDQHGNPEVKVPNIESNSHTPICWHGMSCIAHL